MISKYSQSKNEMEKNEPFLLRPAAKDYLWGGYRLKYDFSKENDCEPLAETWECSTHPAGISIVASGRFKGLGLDEVIKNNPMFLGTHFCDCREMPILIKFIDANKNLSIQVHPDDDYARNKENGQRGKSEMWYVLDAAEDASIIYGFYNDIDDEQIIADAVSKGRLEDYLQKVKVHKDDVFFVEAGTVHAIGEGVLLAEIQENSDLTYRLYDYDRLDKNGKKRELHLQKALEVASLKASLKPRQPMRLLKYRPGCANELLCRCKYFEVYRMLVNTERCRELVKYQADASSYRVLLCINGCGSMSWGEQTVNIFKGDCVFVPADSVEILIHGKAEFLDVRG